MGITFRESSISSSEFTLFRDYINDICGVAISPEKSYLIETRLAKIMIDAGFESFGDFYCHIASNDDAIMRQRIINAITTNETLWFRDELPWKLMEDTILPKLLDEFEERKRTRVRIWCAAVSTGQEAYSTAMCIDDYLSKNRVKRVGLPDFEILATDISTRVLETAKKGRYDKISIARGLGDWYKSKYFEEEGSTWSIDCKIKDAVRFEHFNLQNDCRPFGQFDIIFCRYVLIYFSNELRKAIIARMYDALKDGGVMFTGNYALFEMFEDRFDINHYGNLTYYTKRGVSG